MNDEDYAEDLLKINDERLLKKNEEDY